MSGYRTSNISVISTNAPSSSLCEVMEKNALTALALSTRFADCEICNSIWKALTILPSEGTTSYINLGYFNEALSPKCLTHRPMLEWIQRYYRVLNSRDVKYHRDLKYRRGFKYHRAFRYHRAAVELSFSQPGVIHLREYRSSLCADLLLVRKDSEKDHFGMTRILEHK